MCRISQNAMQASNERMQKTDIDKATGLFAGLNTYVNRHTSSHRFTDVSKIYDSHNSGMFHSHS